LLGIIADHRALVTSALSIIAVPSTGGYLPRS
jgi:hypothetical protein